MPDSKEGCAQSQYGHTAGTITRKMLGSCCCCNLELEIDIVDLYTVQKLGNTDSVIRVFVIKLSATWKSTLVHKLNDLLCEM